MSQEAEALPVRAGSSVLDAPRGGRRGALAMASVGACVVHALIVGAAFAAGDRLQHDVSGARVEKLEVELITPPPPPEPEPEPEAPPPPPPQAAPKVIKAPKPTPAPPKEAPPPAAAESGKLLAADAPVDFGDTFVMGNAAQHAGGVSANDGTAKVAVHDKNAQANGVVGGTGKNPAADLTRAPALASGLHWDCPFPVEADDAGIDSAVVGLRVEVAADGKVKEVKAMADPGHGFSREARRCALGKRWAPGLDRTGQPIAAIALVNVRFER
jgi:protein TonB